MLHSMNLRTLALTPVLGLASWLLGGCVIETTTTPGGGGGTARGVYEACASGQTCALGTSCVQAMYSLTGAAGTICSAACTNGAQCPVSPFGSAYAPTCVVSASAGQGLCYDTCASNVDCGTGTQCARIPGTTASICVPVGTGTVCGGQGQTCCAGQTCAAGLLCTAGSCQTPPPCGGQGQACCAGNVCNAGLGCNGTTCAAANRQPYQKCDVTAGDVCGAGTVCIASTGQVSGKSRGSACTVVCGARGGSVCPGYAQNPNAVACLNLTGNVAEAQCFRLCNTQTECADFNTTCTAFMAGGQMVRACVPVGPRGG